MLSNIGRTVIRHQIEILKTDLKNCRHMERVKEAFGAMGYENTLETSGEDVNLHSKRVKKM
jgi:hypothetical protein